MESSSLYNTRTIKEDRSKGFDIKEEIIMVVQHNMQAVNTNRMLGQNVKAVQKSTEKLSSGYAVNRAADDAAGLSIKSVC